MALQDEIPYPYVPAVRYTGSERFILNDQALPADLLSFWQWSSSNLLGNTMRGCLAEYIVAMALGITSRVRNDWEAYDLVMPVQGSRRQKAMEIDMALADRTVSLDLLVVTPEDFERVWRKLALSCGRPHWRGRCSMTEPRDQPIRSRAGGLRCASCPDVVRSLLSSHLREGSE